MIPVKKYKNGASVDEEREIGCGQGGGGGEREGEESSARGSRLVAWARVLSVLLVRVLVPVQSIVESLCAVSRLCLCCPLPHSGPLSLSVLMLMTTYEHGFLPARPSSN